MNAMNNHCSCCELRKAGTISSSDDDRFSQLPDHILRRVLSFVDSKTTVQTSLLSRRWRSVWKGVPALNFYSKSFPSGVSFLLFVSGILSSRYDSIPIDEISLEVGPDGEVPHARLMYWRLFDYAASHGIRSLRAVNDDNEDFGNFICERGIDFPAMRMLTTLHLEGFKVYCPVKPGSGRGDPFARFQYLRDLTLIECEWAVDGDEGYDEELPDCIRLRISGIQLRNLKIDHLNSVSKVGIFAPNLESLSYVGELRQSEFVELHLPSLDRACIEIHSHRDLDDTAVSTDEFRVPVAVAGRWLMNLFQGLQSATTLELHWETLEILDRVQASFASQTSPFTRLKTLIVNGKCKQKSFGIPYLMLNYFLGNPSNKETKVCRI